MRASQLLFPEVGGDAPASLVGRAMRSINNHIRSNRLTPGDPLPSESSFAESLGVSRPVVREAFRSLAALGVIDAANGRRARVAVMDPAVMALVLDHAVHTNQVSVLQVLDVRRTIETRTVAMAALRRSDHETAEITALAAAMRRDQDDAPRVMEHDIAFHEAIARASGNPLFSLLMQAFQAVTRETWPVGWASRRLVEDRLLSIATHEAIALAIQNRDPRAAEQAMADHFDSTVKVLLAAGIN